ncbi:hypothetical protein MTsPCn9_06900 [Croceitalea sp. MTPC9]|uniref:YaiO family outer membrane beta-barrel protein n=1 Tax=unclassified Croceitalea TaxID=2632280 RepID=UPI002B36EF9C|nr:hypothetical protein MTsPCn6_01810 [Croceitalea sp. MTPC6]GMN15754.1 hypothetical protein MTsPCn9_06900 [Croceitalea sp. MTPC9]
MILRRSTYCTVFMLLSVIGWGQDLADNSYEDAHQLAYEGKHKQAREVLMKIAENSPEDDKAQYLLAKTYTWNGEYTTARKTYNKLISKDKNDKQFWVASIKNELYAGNNATALGLANKAIFYNNDTKEIQRLRRIAKERLENKEYSVLGWYNTDQKIISKHKKSKQTKVESAKIENTSETENNALVGRFGVNNSYTVFSERYDPIFFSNISYRHQTKIGSIIPKVNFSNRNGINGLQYEIDMYPKFLKRFYAYLNYGYSNADIYPEQKVGGDVYVSLPGAFEFSAGGRYIVTRTRNVTAITNSIGHYRGNYYFSLRSFITPRPGNLTRVSANLLTRKYLKDAENYMGISVGVGYSPELRQIVAGDTLLAETLLFIESQRMSLEYQFTSKNSQNIYKARLGVRRQELAFDSNNFFWGITAGLNYNVKF